MRFTRHRREEYTADRICSSGEKFPLALSNASLPTPDALRQTLRERHLEAPEALIRQYERVRSELLALFPMVPVPSDPEVRQMLREVEEALCSDMADAPRLQGRG